MGAAECTGHRRARLREGDGTGEDRLEHRRRQPSGERVLLARVIRTQQRAIADHDLRAMPEPRLGRRSRMAHRRQRPERRIPAHAAQRHDHPQPGEQPHLPDEVRAAGRLLGRRRTVRRRGAPDGGGDPCAAERQPVVCPATDGPIGQPHRMHRPPQEVARRVAREHASGPVAAVSGRRQPDQHDPRVRVAVPGHRPGPVGLGPEAGDLHARLLLAPRDETRAGEAVADRGVEAPAGRWQPRRRPRDR